MDDRYVGERKVLFILKDGDGRKVYVAAPRELKKPSLLAYTHVRYVLHTWLTSCVLRYLKSLTCSGTNRKGLGPKVLVEVSAVSLLGGWKTEVGPTSESRETPSEGGRGG